MKRIQSKLHKIGTYDVCNILLSCFGDKRHVLDDGVNTLPYFHKDIKSNAYGQKVVIILCDYFNYFKRLS